MNELRLSESSAVAAEQPDAGSLWIPLACIASFMVTIVTVVTALVFPGAPHAVTIAIGVVGPFLGVCVAKTIGVTLHWLFARERA